MFPSLLSGRAAMLPDESHVVTVRRADARRTDALASLRTTPARSEHLVFWPTAFIRAPLPLKRTDATQRVSINGALVSTLASGHRLGEDGALVPVGLPYGSLARLLVLFLVTYAVQKNTLVVPLGTSVTAFLRSLGYDVTGGARGTLRRLYDQLERLAACSLHLRWSHRDVLVRPTNSVQRRVDAGANVALVERFALWQQTTLPLAPEPPAAGLLMPEQSAPYPTGARTARPQPPYAQGGRFELSEALTERSLGSVVPLDVRAVEVLRRFPLALDVYAFMTHLAARLEREEQRECVLAWHQLHAQFGRPTRRGKDFTQAFLEALRRVKLVWPSLSYRVLQGRLVVVHQPPHVPHRLLSK